MSFTGPGGMLAYAKSHLVHNQYESTNITAGMLILMYHYTAEQLDVPEFCCIICRLLDSHLSGHIVFNEAPSFYLPAYVRTDDGPVADSCESLDDEPGAGHLRQPVVVGAVQPVVLLLARRDRERTDLVALTVQLLQSARVNVSRFESSHVTHRA